MIGFSVFGFVLFFDSGKSCDDTNKTVKENIRISINRKVLNSFLTTDWRFGGSRERLFTFHIICPRNDANGAMIL